MHSRGLDRGPSGVNGARVLPAHVLWGALSLSTYAAADGFTSVHRHAGVRLVRKAAALDDRGGGVDRGLSAVPGKLAQPLAGLSGSDSEEFHDGALGLPDSGNKRQS